MIEIWEAAANFNTRNQRLEDHIKMILKKGWFSDFEMMEINRQLSREKYDQQLKRNEKLKTKAKT